MMLRFKERVRNLNTLPIKNNPEVMVLNLALDASAAAEVHAILAQLTPEDAVSNTNIKPSHTAVDSATLDSLFSTEQSNIENGAILIGVRDYQETATKLQALVSSYKAKIESEEERSTEFRLENTLIIHLDPTQFQDFVAKVRNLAVEVREKRLWEQDLSTQFVDLKSRLQSKYQAKRRLEQFMKSAKEASEVLPIQRELDAITEEIEAFTKTARALTKKTAKSTLTVTFYQEVLETKPQAADFGNRFVAGAKDGWLNFKEFLIQVALNWPYVTIAMIFILVTWLAVRSSRRRSRQFKMQAMQVQQQWILQQQQQVPVKKTTTTNN